MSYEELWRKIVEVVSNETDPQKGVLEIKRLINEQEEDGEGFGLLDVFIENCPDK